MHAIQLWYSDKIVLIQLNHVQVFNMLMCQDPLTPDSQSNIEQKHVELVKYKSV